MKYEDFFGGGVVSNVVFVDLEHIRGVFIY